MNIITLTVNPAIDIHIASKRIVTGTDNPSRLLRRDSGGKGVNVSRALHSYGVDNLCYMILGEKDARDFICPLAELGMNIAYTTVEGFVRENINIHTAEGETVIATEGPRVDEEAVGRMRDTISEMVKNDTVLCLNGRISPSSDKDAILAFLSQMKDKGARIVLDSKSLSLDEILKLTPYLIKPNLEEAEALLGIKIESTTEALRSAHRLHTMGISHVIITLGKEGAVYSGDDGDYFAKAPSVDVVSSVGAGDSAIAGFLTAKCMGMSYSDPLRYAVAFGTAACMEEGSLPPAPCRINDLIAGITTLGL